VLLTKHGKSCGRNYAAVGRITWQLVLDHVGEVAFVAGREPQLGAACAAAVAGGVYAVQLAVEQQVLSGFSCRWRSCAAQLQL
jgi:hypothetical protein